MVVVSLLSNWLSGVMVSSIGFPRWYHCLRNGPNRLGEYRGPDLGAGCLAYELIVSSTLERPGDELDMGSRVDVRVYRRAYTTLTLSSSHGNTSFRRIFLTTSRG